MLPAEEVTQLLGACNCSVFGRFCLASTVCDARSAAVNESTLGKLEKKKRVETLFIFGFQIPNPSSLLLLSHTSQVASIIVKHCHDM